MPGEASQEDLRRLLPRPLQGVLGSSSKNVTQRASCHCGIPSSRALALIFCPGVGGDGGGEQQFYKTAHLFMEGLLSFTTQTETVQV